MTRSTRIVSSSYYDSVVLMRIASQLKKSDGVREVAMFMGTEGNHELLAQVGLASELSAAAGAQDLIIIVEAESAELADAVSRQAEAQLTSKRSQSGDSESEYRPRTIDTALGLLPDASLAALSIPGEYAAREARKCLEKGLNVFLFSDNVPIEAEIALKQRALAKNRLCMGPDCGTAYLHGTGLGFANVIRSGRVGCIAASGTGLQAVVCEIDRLGEGVSHGLGVGGRDLSGEVGGLMTLFCLDLLEQDEQTEVIILLSKPAHPATLAKLNAVCLKMSKPVVACFLGAGAVGEAFVSAGSLDEAAAQAVSLLQRRTYTPRLFTEPRRLGELLEKAGTAAAGKRLIGLFTGGTLAKEAQLLLSPHLGSISSSADGSGHLIIDLGDDRYTIGKPHPMIAPESRTEMLLELAATGRLDDCGVVLVDLVLGSGSHLDPAEELVQGFARLSADYRRKPQVVCAVIGTPADPQDLAAQIEKLEQAGMVVFRLNSEAARYAAMLAAPACCSTFLQEVS